MVFIIIMAILVILALAFFFWMIRYTAVKVCPHCQQEDNDEMVIPIIPGWIWWCPTCNETSKQRNLANRSEKNSSKQD